MFFEKQKVQTYADTGGSQISSVAPDPDGSRRPSAAGLMDGDDDRFSDGSEPGAGAGLAEGRWALARAALKQYERINVPSVDLAGPDGSL